MSTLTILVSRKEQLSRERRHVEQALADTEKHYARLQQRGQMLDEEIAAVQEGIDHLKKEGASG